MPNRASPSATESVANIAKVLHMKVMNGRWTPASVAIMLTLMRRNGFVEIDAACEFDRDQRVLTPGEAVLLIVGVTALRNRRIPLYKIGRQYESMNIEGILGKRISVESLNDTALSRALDTLYKADWEKLFWSIAKEMRESKVWNPVYSISIRPRSGRMWPILRNAIRMPPGPS